MNTPVTALRLGASATLAGYVLPQLLTQFGHQFPEIAITLLPLNSVDVAAALLRHELDLGFVESTARLPTLRYERLLYDEIIAVRVAGAASLAAPLTLADALAHPLVLSEPGSGMLDVVETTLRHHGVLLADLPTPPQHFVAHADIKAALRATPESLSFISRRGVITELLSGEFEQVPIQGLLMNRELLAAWRADAAPTPPAQQLLDFCRAYYQR